MGKEKELVDFRENILSAAKKSNIKQILFNKPLHRECQEEDDFVYCLLDIEGEPDKQGQNIRGCLLDKFENEIKQFLTFELLIETLDTKEKSLQAMPDELEKEYRATITAAIPLEKLVRNVPLLDQIENALLRLQKEEVKASKSSEESKSLRNGR